jgi:uncharacterized membrane-anchored protein
MVGKSGAGKSGPPPAAGLSDHHLRQALTSEVHARPYALLKSPERASHLAVLSGEGGGDRDRAHLAELCATFGLAPPALGANHFAGDLGEFRLKWERHTEFSSYTFFRRESFEAPFDDPVIGRVPPGWLDTLPGSVLLAIHIALVARVGVEPNFRELATHFSPDFLAGSRMASGAAAAWTDFRIHDDGFGRILIQDRGLRERQAGRLVQRLLEIETYRLMALLAFPVARDAGPKVSRVENELAEVTAKMSAIEGIEDEHALLGRLSRLAADIEGTAAATGFRFGAARAYYALVERRIGELREERIEGLQTIGEFMERRLAPAMGTCESTAARLVSLSERVARASNLLRTNVDIALEGQNQDLLRSMDRRARIQLHLQQTFEGLSVAAISYYLAGLIGYLAKAARGAGVGIDPDLTVGIAVPFIVAGVWFAVRRIRRAVMRERED